MGRKLYIIPKYPPFDEKTAEENTILDLQKKGISPTLVGVGPEPDGGWPVNPDWTEGFNSRMANLRQLNEARHQQAIKAACTKARSLGIAEVAEGVPPRLAGIVEDAQLPTAHEEPDLPVGPVPRNFATEVDEIKAGLTAIKTRLGIT